MYIRFYWTCDRIEQGKLNVYYRKGVFYLCDYHSKHHPPTHHIKIWRTYLHVSGDKFSNMQGCVEATAGIERPSSKQVAKYSQYDNGTKDATGTDMLRGTQVAMYG